MRPVFTVSALVFAAAVIPAHAQQSVPFANQPTVRVMTRNVDHGVLKPILDVATATDPEDFRQKVADVYRAYFGKNFPARAAALAAEIDATRPDLIGLQEAVLVRTQFPADGPRTPAQTVALDYVQILLDALAARGLAYEIAAHRDGFDVELPSALGFDVRHTDREVHPGPGRSANVGSEAVERKRRQLRSELLHPQCTARQRDHQPQLGIGGREDPRGSFRFLSTHLDGDCLPYFGFQRAQANELPAGPADTELPVLIVGDFNSPADGTGATYNDMIAAGFIDAWTVAGNGAGPTCCQADDLLNPVSLLDRCIDFALYRGDFVPLDAG